jgi:antitoxin ParD1/3/4
MPVMNLNLDISADLQHFMHSVIDRGEFHTESEVVGEALRLLQERRRRIEALRQEILPAIERLDRGEGIEVREDELDGFFDGIVAEIDPSFQKDEPGR